MSSARRRIVIAGGTGPLGRELQKRLEGDFEVLAVGTRDATNANTWKANVLSVPETEVALAGADTVVFLARTSGARARLLQGVPADVDAVLADSVARAAKLVGAKRLVAFFTNEQDEREALLRASGVPLSVLSGGGDEPVRQLEELVRASDVETRRLPAGKGASGTASAWSGASTVLSVQRLPRKAGRTAAQLTRDYFEWLPTDVPTVKTVLGSTTYEVLLSGVSVLRLRRLEGQCRDELEVLEVRDGAFVASGKVGVFEFRLAGDALFTTLRDFVPAMPWLMYRASQAPMHARTMRRFGAFLSKG